MTFILNIETATPVCSVALSNRNNLIAKRETTEENAHSSRITIFIDECLKEAGLKIADLNAVALSSGPGSYTGLRIGAATAKGLCYVLNIPLISVSTLQAMAAGFLSEVELTNEDFLLCPMIDARRMEVYFALHTAELKEIKPPSAGVINSDFLTEFRKKKIYFFGTGASKCRPIVDERTFHFENGNFISAENLISPAFNKFLEKKFEDVTLFEPFYLKEFYTGATLKP